MKRLLIAAAITALSFAGSTAHAQDAEYDPTAPGLPWTWLNMTPEQYEITPLTSGWPWCSSGGYPTSYKWQAPCVPVDPCQVTEFGGHTLWEMKPCDPVGADVVLDRGDASPDAAAPEPPPVTTPPVTPAAPVAVAAPAPTLTPAPQPEPVAVWPTWLNDFQAALIANGGW